MKTYIHIRCVIFSAVVALFLSTSIFAQLAPFGGKDKKNEKAAVDPLLKNLAGQLSFDEETKKALERGKTPGELLAESENPNFIYKIKILGAKKIEPDAVVLRLKTKINSNYDEIKIREDIREISKMGFFSNIKVLKKIRSSGAVELAYVLQEIPTIFQVKISGNIALDTEKIRESIADLQNYQGAQDKRMQESVDKIREFYISKGYLLADVSYKLEPTKIEEIKKRESAGLNDLSKGFAHDIDTTQVRAPDFVDIIFTIKENEKIRVNYVGFMGNTHLDDHKLKSSIRTREQHLLSVLTEWGTFRQDFLEYDTLILEKLLHDNGMLKAKILTPIVDLSPDKSTVSITFPMVENKQYFLGEVSISGDLVESSDLIYEIKKRENPDTPIFLKEKLLKKITLNKKDVFNKSLMGNNILGIAEKYRDKGFAYANISPVPNFDEENNIVNINIKASSGPRVTIERIEIEGNESTKDEVIRRQLEIFEGKYYSSSLMRLSEQRVKRLGYFESIEFAEKPGSAEDLMHVVIKVKEKSTGHVQVGAGYGTGGEGIVFRGQVSNQNLFGRGQTLSATVNWSNYRRLVDVSFIEPYIGYVFDNPMSLAFTAYNREINLGDFNRSAFGGDITMGYPVGGPLAHISRKWKRKARESLSYYVLDFDSLWLYLTYTAERVEISDLTTDVSLHNLFQGVPRYTTSIRPTIRLDQRDNRLFPTEGLYFEFRSEFATEYLGGIGLSKLENYIRNQRRKNQVGLNRDMFTPKAQANNFLRFGTNFRFYHNLDNWFFLKGFVFKTNLDIGFLNTLGNPLIFENYMLGGINTIRGYPYRSISPTQRSAALFPFDPRREVRVGGNKQILGSFELEFPILKVLKLSGVFFFDWGNVYSHEDNLFYAGGRSKLAARVKPNDPLRLYDALGIYSSAGFGVRWLNPLGLMRFEWGFPINRRPASTPGLREKDPPVIFELNVGSSF